MARATGRRGWVRSRSTLARRFWLAPQGLRWQLEGQHTQAGEEKKETGGVCTEKSDLSETV